MLVGPVFQIPCNGMHFEPGTEHTWERDEELNEFCIE